MSVNSFGFGGSYGNCVVEESKLVIDPAPSTEDDYHGDDSCHCLPLSAKSVPALQDMAKAYAEWIGKSSLSGHLGIIASNLWNRRSRLPVRKAFVGKSVADISEQMKAFAELEGPENVRRTNDDRDPIVVFSGQGSQWAGMGKVLYEQGGVFKRTVDLIDSYWMELSGHALSDRTFDEAVGNAINEPVNAQSCTFLVQAALFETLKHRGLSPACVLGHSAGESMAGYACGAYTLKEACFLVYHRATLQQQLSGCGRMLVVLGIEHEELMEVLKGEEFASLGLELACRNSPMNTVITSTAESIATAKELLEDRSLNCKLIRGTTAFHSRQMEPIKGALYEAYSDLDARAPRIPMFSTVSGDRVGELDTDYWWANVRQPVLFTAALDAALEAFPAAPIVEISPHPTLVSPARECVPSCVYLTTLDRKKEETNALEAAVGQMFENGVRFDRLRLSPGTSIAHLLPTYPFTKEKCLHKNADQFFPYAAHMHSNGPLVGKKDDSTSDVRTYSTCLTLENYKYMEGHKINGVVLFPAAGYLECLFEIFEGEPICIEKMDILMACEVTDEAKAQKLLETKVIPMGTSDTHFRFSISSRVFREADTLHAVGVLRRLTDAEIEEGGSEKMTRELIEDFDQRALSSSDSIYSNLETKIDKYFNYSGVFKVMTEANISTRRQELLARLELDEFESWQEGGYIFHPAHMDGVLQTFCVIIMLQQGTPYRGVPTGIHDMKFYRKPTGKEVLVHYKAPQRLEGTARRHGILSYKLGPVDSGGVTVYDGQTLEVIATIDTYVSSQSIAAFMKDDPQMKLVWQPKIVEDMHAALGGDNLLADVRSMLAAASSGGRMLSVAEIVAVPTGEGDAKPSLVVDGLLDDLSGSGIRYSLLCDELEPLIEAFDATSGYHNEIIARFHKLDETTMSKLSGAFDVLICGVDPSASVRSLVAPRGYVIDASGGGGGVSNLDSWETVALPRADGGYVVRRKGAVMDAYERPAAAEEGDLADAEATAAPLREVVGHNEFADCFRENGDLEAAFAGYPEPMYFFFGGLDGPVASSDAMPYAAAWSLVDWFTDNLGRMKPGSTIVVVTRSAIAYRSGSDAVVDPRMRAVWGSFRTIKEEYADFKFVVADIGSVADVAMLGQVIELGEEELVIRGAEVFCPRFLREGGVRIDALPQGQLCRLVVTGSGSLDDLRFELHDRHEPPAGHLELEIKASALNFRDIMVTLGKLPFMSYERSGLGKTVGMECSGVVTRVGSGVHGFQVGDEVIGTGPNLVADYAILPQTGVMKKPASMSFERASAYPSVYITAFYALVDHARLRKGQSVLIHSALGGVGIAAMNICRRIGAVVYATAGTDAKREKLREMGCAGVFDSHSLSWYEDLMRATGGKGVNAALNSLAGEHLDLCLKAICDGGTHCEIGKMDVFADRPLHMMVFRKNLKLAVIDIDRLGLVDPELLNELLLRSAEFYKDGEEFEMPIQTFPYAEYDRAMRYMMKGQHTGKIVLVPPSGSAGAAAAPAPLPLPVLDTRMLFVGWPKTVAMTGAMGGMGIRMFAYLADNGVQNFLLLDRDPDLRRDGAWMIGRSALGYYHRSDPSRLDALKVKTRFVDLTDAAMVADALSPESLAGMGLPELGAVVHLAGVNDDKFSVNVTEASMKYVFDSKVLGAINLHEATKEQPSVEHFIVFSSIVAVLGNATQATYSAANSFLDGLVERRRGAGLPALSYNMAAVMDAGGMASDDVNVLKGMIASGVRPISCIEALNSLDIAIRDASASHIISFAATRFKPSLRDSRRIGHMASTKEAFTLSKSSGELNLQSVVSKLSAKVCEVCDTDSVDADQPLSDLGLNSVSMVELANFIQYEYEVEISPMKLMTGSCLGEVAESIMATISNTGAENDADDAQATRQRVSFKVGEDLDKYLDMLPKWCRQDFDIVRYRTKSKNMRRSAGSQEYRRCEKKDALVTGATGFLGSFLAAELLERDDVGTVYCLVRPSAGMTVSDRLRKGMQETGVWEERHLESGRLVAVQADLEKPHFDLDQEKWESLSSSVDMVYHFAADINLYKSYDEIRTLNTRSMIDLIDFSVEGCKKDVHYASTLGIFPQYIASFEGRFRDTSIDFYGRPDVEDMKDVFKRQLGYPWSKLMAELMIEEARNQIGLSAFVYRIPLTYYASKTGYMKFDDIALKIAKASIETGYTPLPKGSLLGAGSTQECGSSVSKIISDLSLDGRRSHWLYHVLPGGMSHNTMSSSDEKAKDVVNLPLARSLEQLSGMYAGNLDGMSSIQSIPYPEFRMRFYSDAEDSTLYGLWGLLDYYGATFWFDDSGSENGDSDSERSFASLFSLIDVGAAEEDLPYSFKLIDRARVAFRAVDWLNKTESGFASTLRRFAREQDVPWETRVAALRDSCNVVDVSYEDVMPPPVEDNLKMLIGAVDSPDSRKNMSLLSQFMFWAMQSGRFLNRIQIHRSLREFPEIHAHVIHRPIFIVGLNRTGTTFLQRVMSATGAVDCVSVNDQSLIVDPGALSTASPADILDGMRDRSRYFLEQQHLLGASMTSHIISGSEAVGSVPEEDFEPLTRSFGSAFDFVMHDIADVFESVDSCAEKMDFVYQEHKEWAKYQTFLRQRLTGREVERWLFKMPFHMRYLQSLFKAYPDAVLVHTHRPLEKVLPSWCKLVEEVRGSTTDAADKHAIGAQQLKFVQENLNRVRAFREANPELEKQILDVHFDNIIADPLGVVRQIATHAGITLTAEQEKSVSDYVSSYQSQFSSASFNDKPATLEEYGLSHLAA